MNVNDLVVTNVDCMNVDDKLFPIRNCIINSVSDNGIKHIDIYAIATDIKTKEEHKIKIRIVGGSFEFYEVGDEEWGNIYEDL